MRTSINQVQGWIWFGFTLLLGVSLVWNAIDFAFGDAKTLAIWWWPFLPLCWKMTRLQLHQQSLARLRNFVVQLGKQAAKSLSHIKAQAGEVIRGLASLLASQTNNRTQTEP